MSFVTARTRIGALVMLVHDFSDISLEVSITITQKQMNLNQFINQEYSIFVLFFIFQVLMIKFVYPTEPYC